MNDLRVTKGLAYYVGNFTLDKNPFVYDEYLDNVGVFCNFNGTNGSTTFTDVKGKTITPVGDVYISTPQYDFNYSSCRLNGPGAYLSIGASSDFDFGSGDFTVECWFKVDNLSRQ